MNALADLDRESLEHLVLTLREANRRHAGELFFRLFPDRDAPEPVGPLLDGGIVYARSKYPRHLEFFKAGAQYRERCFMAGNRVGKTFGGGYELAAHLTGLYPDWWEGRRFQRPVRAWAAGKTNETTRDILQLALLGPVSSGGALKGVSGTGLIPGSTLGGLTWSKHAPDMVDSIRVRHASGGWSVLGLKSYKQGRGSFEGTAQHVILLDEEPPISIYGECLVRTATTGGIIMLTFTPVEGLTETALMFMPQDMRPDGA